MAPTEILVPADMRKALTADAKLQAAWKSLTPIGRRDFVEWVTSAKQAETRSRRVAVACSKLAAGQRRPCCYAVVPMPLYKVLGSNPKAKSQWSTLSPDEKRDFSAWVNAVQGDIQKARIEKTCALLCAGARKP